MKASSIRFQLWRCRRGVDDLSGLGLWPNFTVRANGRAGWDDRGVTPQWPWHWPCRIAHSSRAEPIPGPPTPPAMLPLLSLRGSRYGTAACFTHGAPRDPMLVVWELGVFTEEKAPCARAGALVQSTHR